MIKIKILKKSKSVNIIGGNLNKEIIDELKRFHVKTVCNFKFYKTDIKLDYINFINNYGRQGYLYFNKEEFEQLEFKHQGDFKIDNYCIPVIIDSKKYFIKPKNGDTYNKFWRITRNDLKTKMFLIKETGIIITENNYEIMELNPKLALQLKIGTEFLTLEELKIEVIS